MAYVPPLNGGRINASIAGNTAGVASAGAVSTGTVVFAGGNNVTLSQTTNANGLTVSVNAAGGGVALYDGANSISSGTARISAGGGLTASINGQTLSLSAPVISTVSATGALSISSNGATVSMGVPAFSIGISSTLGNTAGTTGTVSNQLILAGGNNITLSQSTGVGGNTLSVVGPSNPAMSGSNGSFTYQTATFGNLNGLSFYTSNGSVVGSHNAITSQSAQTANFYVSSNSTQLSSTAGVDLRSVTYQGAGAASIGLSQGKVLVSVPTQTNQTANLYVSSNSTQLSSTAGIDLRSISFQGAGNVSVGVSQGKVLISGGGGGGGAALSAGTQSVSTGTVNFANSNGISFGMSGSNQITASYTVPTQSNQSVGLYALGNTTQNSSTTLDARSLSFNGLGAATMGYSNGSIQVSAPVVSSLSATGAVSISNNAGTISIGAPVQTNQTQSNIQGIIASGSTNYTGNISFANSNGVTFGLSNNTVTASVAGGGGGVALANSQTTYTSGTVNLLEGGGAITIASTTGQKYNVSVPAVSSLSVTGALSISRNASTISIGVPAFSAGMSNIGNTSGTSGTASNQVIFAGGNNITLSQSTGAGGNTISIIGGAGGGGGGVALSAGGALYSSGTLNLSNAGGALTLSTNPSSVLNMSVPATSSIIGTNGISLSTTSNSIYIDGGGLTLSYFNPQDAYLQVTGAHGNGTLHIQPVQAPNVQFDRIAIPIYYTNATNSTASVSLSLSVGFYTRNASTLSLASSASSSLAWVGSGNASAATYNGVRLFTIGNTNTLYEGQYYVGIASSSATGGNNATLQQIVASQQASNFSGIFGAASATSAQYTRGLGYYSASISSLPASVGFSQIRGTGSMALRQPFFYLVSQTF